MKNFKKVLLTGIITIGTIFAMTAISNATVVKVTGDTINVRKRPSTDSEIIAMLSKDVKCKLLEEQNDWYKIQYEKYIGYISKQYSKKVDNSSNEGTSLTPPSIENTQKDDTKDINKKAEDEKVLENKKGIYKKLNKDTYIKILPLIYSSKIADIKKNEKVLILAEAGNWIFIQTDEINGWIRNNFLENETVELDKKTDISNKENTQIEKLGYISEEFVNMRKGASINDNIIKVLPLNAKLTIIEEEGNWYKVKSGKNIGYVSKEFVSDTKKVTSRELLSSRAETPKKYNEKKGYINENCVNIRKGASRNDKVIKQVILNTELTVIGEEGDWYKIKLEQDTGYVLKELVSDAKKVTSTKLSSSKTGVSKKDEEKINTKGIDIIAYAKKFLGAKYVYGGDGSDGTFDCSGFTMYVYRHFGIKLPHGATSQYNCGKGIKISKKEDLKTGDLVLLTDYKTGKGIGHCGLYIGDGEFIHASSTYKKVTISSFNNIYKNRFYAGLRLI